MISHTSFLQRINLLCVLVPEEKWFFFFKFQTIRNKNWPWQPCFCPNWMKSFLKTKWQVSDAGSVHWVSNFVFVLCLVCSMLSVSLAMDCPWFSLMFNYTILLIYGKYNFAVPSELNSIFYCQINLEGVCDKYGF
jgi:hypothetical protein